MPRKRIPLSRERILDVALSLVDEQGLEGLSMRKLAAQLDVEAMSLYNHIKDKNDLLNGLLNKVLSTIEQPTFPMTWQDTLTYFANSFYQTFLEHRALASVIDLVEPASPQVLQGMDYVLSALDQTGLSPHEQVSAFRGLIAMCLGFVNAHTFGMTMSKEEAQVQWEHWNEKEFTGSGLSHLIKMAPYFQEIHADDDFRFMLTMFIGFLAQQAKS